MLGVLNITLPRLKNIWIFATQRPGVAIHLSTYIKSQLYFRVRWYIQCDLRLLITFVCESFRQRPVCKLIKSFRLRVTVRLVP